MRCPHQNTKDHTNKAGLVGTSPSCKQRHLLQKGVRHIAKNGGGGGGLAAWLFVLLCCG